MHIFINGYWETNLGDDLFLYIISKKFPKVQFDIYTTRKNFSVFKGISNVNLINKRDSLIDRVINKVSVKVNYPLKGSEYDQLIQTAKGYPVYLELGGSIFMLPSNGSLNVDYLVRMIIAKRVKHYLVIGSNFGPYSSHKQLIKYQHFFKSIESISFRDEYSYNLFKNCGGVNYFPDIVFNLSVQNNYKADYVLFSVINTKRFGSYVDKMYTQFVCNQVKKEISRGNEVVLMSFCNHEGDKKKAREIKDRLIGVSKNIRIVEHSNIYKSLKIISGSKKIFATRYHSMILGWVFKKPTFVVSYSKKTENVIKSFFPQQSYVKLTNINENKNIKYTLIDDRTLIALKDEANKHFSDFEKVIQTYE